MAAQEFAISLHCPLADFFPPLVPRRTDRNPILDPLSDRHLVGRNVFTNVAGMEELAQNFICLGLCAVDRLDEGLAANPVPKSPSIFSTSIQTTGSITALTHAAPPFSPWHVVEQS